MSTITIIVGNVGTVLETTDAKEASDIYRHYCDASDRGDGRMAREDVTMMHTVTHKDINGIERIVDDVPVLEHVGYDSRLESMDDGAFMSSVITAKLPWYSIESSDGTTYIQIADVGDLPGLTVAGDAVSFVDDCITKDLETKQQTIRDALSDYVDGSIESVEFVTGHGARLSASGYMDCTDWTIHTTEHDAIVYLVETYGDDVGTDG